MRFWLFEIFLYLVISKSKAPLSKKQVYDSSAKVTVTLPVAFS